MGLYLCVFKDEEELEGVEVGSYADYGYFIETVTDLLEDGIAGSKFPVLILHSDSDGSWSIEECRSLEKELETISKSFKFLLPREFNSEWQRQLSKSLGLTPQNLCESFIDVDGEPLIERMIHLCRVALKANEPILFQ